MTSATFDQRGFDADPEVLEPERVSILAILGLVFGLICFIPLLPLLGVICAIAGLIAINRARGRLAGTGMAIAGLIVGLLFTALQGALALGATQVLSTVSTQMVGPAGMLVASIDNEDYTKVREELVPLSQPMATDEAFKAFRDAYRAELGAFKSAPKGMMELIWAYADVGQQFQAMNNQNMQGRNDVIPVPVVFEKGSGLLLLAFEQPGRMPSKPGEEFKFHFKNISLILPSGKAINLIDPATIPPPTIQTVPPPGQTPPPAGSDAPKDEKGAGEGGDTESVDTPKDSGGGG
ncbi:MAG: DUF4190 domain-containing protein [Phycisphaerales bacterium]|nr:DUF4190 domain-containing protein [Phycisphaerales bacterium]